MTSQLEILEQRLFTAFASADWRDPETREKVYAAIERAILRLADRPEAESSYQGYVDAFAELRWRVERSADEATDLDDLAARIAAFSAPEAEAPPVAPEAAEPPPPPPVVTPPAPPPFRPAPPLVAEPSPVRDAEPEPEPPAPPPPAPPESPTLGAPGSDLRPAGRALSGPGEWEGTLPPPSLVQRLALPVVAALAGLALLLGLFGVMRSSGPDYDSGWVQASNAAPNVVAFQHRFGTVPRTVTIWFSADRGTTASLVAWKWPASESGNPISVVATGEAVELHIWNGAPLHGTFDTKQNRWTTHTTGYFRVVAGR